MAANDLTLLQSSAEKYNRELKYLPVAVLRETLGRAGINMLPGIQYKDTIVNYERNGGIAKPYVSGDLVNSNLGQAKESTLEVAPSYASVKDNIQNYQKIAVGPDQLLNKNKTKQHPWNRVMLWAIVSTFGEDILDALWPAARDTDNKTPQGMFDGFDTHIDTAIAAGTIAAGKGNYVSTGSISKPTSESDTDAYDVLLAFWRSAHPMLRSAQTILQVPNDVYDAYVDAYFNKYRQKPTVDAYNRIYLDGSGGKCRIVPITAMGTGDRIVLMKSGLYDFGADNATDHQFVQVRDPYEDPNFKQFWIQGSYGTRIRTVHQKMFQVNDGTPVKNLLSGDYDSDSTRDSV